MKTNDRTRMSSIIKVIKTIQRTKWNFYCYGTPVIIHCSRTTCLWKLECLNNSVKKPVS